MVCESLSSELATSRAVSRSKKKKKDNNHIYIAIPPTQCSSDAEILIKDNSRSTSSI